MPKKLALNVKLHAALHSLALRAQRDIMRLPQDPELYIHSLRTGMKKYRSILRLVRSEIKTSYRTALLDRVRILKDGLAGSRDDSVIFKTVGKALGVEAAERINLRSPHVEQGIHVPTALYLASSELITLTELLNLRALKKRNLKRRWKKTVKKSKVAMKAAAKSGNSCDFHIWRKRTKDVWYQCDVLSKLSKKIAAKLKPMRRLSHVLGREHDITIVLNTVKTLNKVDSRKIESKASCVA